MKGNSFSVLFSVFTLAQCFGRGAFAAAVTDPLVAVNPPIQTVVAGRDVSFEATPVGTEPIRFSWSVNGSVIPGATSSTLALAGVSPEDSGTYVVTVWNSIATNRALARLQVDGISFTATPVGLTGWNFDAIIEVDGQPVQNWCFDGNGAQWIEAGFRGHPDGFPSSGRFTSAVNTDVQFQLQPYNTNNVLLLSSSERSPVIASTPPDSPEGTLYLLKPARYSYLAIAAASGNRGGIGKIRINFTDGTTSQLLDLIAPDWWANPALPGYWPYSEKPGIRAIFGLGQFLYPFSLYAVPDGYGFGLFETDLDLAAQGLDTKPIESLTFIKPPLITSTTPVETRNGPVTTGIFAVSGVLKELAFSGIHRDTDGRVQLRLNVPPHALLRLDSSVDLQTWTPLITITNADPHVVATDVPPAVLETRFYRAVQEQ